MIFQVLDIIKGTTVDGPGFRTAIYLAGCSHRCPGCHNPQSWEESNGRPMSIEEIMGIVEEEDFDVTLSGGDPLYNPIGIKKLTEAIKNNRRNLWIYTGYSWEQIIESPQLFEAVKDCDVLVDGEFVESLKNPDLPFRGSSNQRIINVQESIKQGKIILVNRE